MSYGFGNINTGSDKIYLKEAGLHINCKFIGLSYGATEEYEYFDFEAETPDGRYFRERTFGPDINKVYPKALYKGGQKIGEETRDQAFERVKSEINTKLFYLALCFVPKDVLSTKAASVKSFKELVDAVAKLIDLPSDTKINMLTVWKNSDSRQKSNLIIAERVKWCEPYTEGRTAGIHLTKWQLDNQTVEKYPYRPDNSVDETNNSAIIDGGEGVPATDQLPF